MLNSPRPSRGGGVGLIYKSQFDIKKQNATDFKSFEYMECILKNNGNWLRIVVVYRPPPSKKNKLTAVMFLTEFQILLEKLATASGELLLIGDFNFHVGTDKPDALRFLTMLDDFGLKQHVSQPTNIHEHILDLVITRSAEHVVSDIKIKEPCLSDHKAIMFNVIVEKPKLLSKKIQFRNWKAVDLSSFNIDLAQSEL